MNQPVNVRVHDLIGSPLCVSADDGQRLHDKIAPLLEENIPVTLSFKGVDTIISAFLNAAIGQLYGEFPEEHVRELISFEDLSADDHELVRRVVENAIIYFTHMDEFDRAWQEELWDDEDDEDE